LTLENSEEGIANFGALFQSLVATGLSETVVYRLGHFEKTVDFGGKREVYFSAWFCCRCWVKRVRNTLKN